jgi:tetratricopeptide (TPR) repeat protein
MVTRSVFMRMFGYVLALAMVGCVMCSVVHAQAQPSQAAIERIELLRSQIKAAQDGHAGPAELGTLWLKLGNSYQDQVELAPAEDAFMHALRLLEAPGTESAYANALDGLGSVYLEMGRLSEAPPCLKKSLAIYETLQDHAHAAAVHDALAMIYLNQNQYREAEQESVKGLAELQWQATPNPEELSSAYLTHSYAVCYQGRCKEALADTSRAMEIVKGKLAANSIDVAAVWRARGLAEWKAGFPDEGEKSMGEALRIVRSRTDWPTLLRVSGEIGVLRQYAMLLKESHRKQDAKLIEAQIAAVEGDAPHPCSDCTVNAAAVGMGFLSH